MAETGPHTPLHIKGFYGYIRPVTKECLFDWEAMITQTRVAIYARVSTIDKGQDPETPLLVQRDYAARRGLGPAGE